MLEEDACGTGAAAGIALTGRTGTRETMALSAVESSMKLRRENMFAGVCLVSAGCGKVETEGRVLSVTCTGGMCREDGEGRKECWTLDCVKRRSGVARKERVECKRLLGWNLMLCCEAHA